MGYGKNNPVLERVVTLTNYDNEEGILGNAETVEVPQNVQASKDDKPMFQEVDIVGVSGSKNVGGSKKWVCKHCHQMFISSYIYTNICTFFWFCNR